MALTLTNIPTDFGSGGANLAPNGAAGTPSLRTILEEHRSALATLDSGSGTVTSWKAPVRAATTTNGTLASAFANGQTVDGVTLVTADRILLKNQTTTTQNGIYTVNASGAPTRATDADTGAELLGAAMVVTEGTTNADTTWVCTTNATITVGSTAIAFAQFSGGITALTGDVTASGTGSVTTTIANSAVTLAKMADLATARFIGRNTAGTGAPEALSVATVLTMLGLPNFGTSTTLTLLNSASAPVNSLTLVNTLTTNTAGAEVSNWVVGGINAGSAATFLTIAPTLLTLGGTLAVGTSSGMTIKASSTENTGIGRPFAQTFGIYANGTNVINITGAGIFAATSAQGYFLDNGSAAIGMKLQGSNATIFSSVDVQIGVDGALATSATAGFLAIPAMAGTPSGVPAPRTGKVLLGYDSTNNKLIIYNGAWKQTVALS